MPLLLRITAIFCFLFTAASACAQTNSNVIGVWKGIMKDSLSSFDYTIRITDVMDGEVTGTGVSGNQSLFCETKIKGSFKNGRLVVYETEIIRTNYRDKEVVCLLGLDVSVNNKALEGKFHPVTNESNCLPGIANLSWVPNTEYPLKTPVDTPVKARAVTSVAVKAQPLYQERKLALIKEINIDAEEADIQLFDNGVVDGDSITLTDNNKEIFSKAMLSTTALKYKISNKETNIHSIAFIADNLGTIPPNTGLMVISANRQRWEIYFSSDFAKTSYVKVILKEKKKE